MMDNLHKWRLWGAAVLLGLFCAVGLAGGHTAALAESPSPLPNDEVVTFRVGWTTEPDSLNPFIGYETSAWEIFQLNYDLLVGVDPADLQPRPALAESWSTSGDGTVWTFELRRDVTWHDGEPFTSADVVFTFDYIMENELLNFINYTENIESVTAIDDHTVEITCSRPKANMLGTLIWIVPEHIWSEIPAEDAQNTHENAPPIVGTGSFQVVEWEKGNYVRMQANPNYWGGGPNVDEIIFTSYSNADSMAQDLRSGALQAAWGIPTAQFEQIGREPDLTAIEGVVNGFTYLGFNCYDDAASLGNPVLQDWRFRNALNYAVDKGQIVSVAYDGHASPATSIIRADYFPPELDWHWQPPDDEVYHYDPEEAMRLLDEAGYRDGDGDGYRDIDGQPIELRFFVRSQAAADQRVAKLVTGWLEEVGLRIDLQVLDEAAIFDRIYNFKGETYAPDYDLFLWYWDSEPDPNFILSVLTSGQIGWGSDSQWSNEEYDRLYVEQQSTTDQQERKDVVWEMQRIAHEQSPYIPLTYAVWLEGYNTGRWTGWVRTPAGDGPVIYAIYNVDTYRSVVPRPAVTDEAGSNTGLVVGIIVAAVAVVAAGVVTVVVVRRRRSRVEEV